MVRAVPFVLLALLTGCVEPAAPARPPQPSVPDSCGAAGLQGLVGQPKSVLARMNLPRDSRVIGPDQAVTMDFRPDRLNIETDRDGRIARIGCY